MHWYASIWIAIALAVSLVALWIYRRASPTLGRGEDHRPETDTTTETAPERDAARDSDSGRVSWEQPPPPPTANETREAQQLFDSLADKAESLRDPAAAHASTAARTAAQPKSTQEKLTRLVARQTAEADAAAKAPREEQPTRQMRVRPVRQRSRTRHPIVLAHGFGGGFDPLLPQQLGVQYFRGIPDALRSQGHVVHVAHVSPTASIERRAKSLAKQIRQFDSRVNIIAHSMGGLDARYAISRFGLDEYVTSLTTIGTPHHGTPLADVALVLGDLKRARKLLRAIGLNVDGVYDLSTESMGRFNENVPNSSDVLYANIVAAASPENPVNKMLTASYRYLLKVSGANDGVVPSRSQLWGETLEEIDADHWAQIGWFAPFDVNALYTRIASKLASRDL